MKIRAVFIILVVSAIVSCSKDNSSTNLVKYIIKATYDNPAYHDGLTNAQVTHVALTMPRGNNSVSENLSTPYISLEREYSSGTTITARCASAHSHVTITVEIWLNGTKWKHLTVNGSDSYTDATVTGTL